MLINQVLKIHSFYLLTFVATLLRTITSSCPILSNSALTLVKRGTGTWHGGVNAKVLLFLLSECDNQ